MKLRDAKRATKIAAARAALRKAERTTVFGVTVPMLIGTFAAVSVMYLTLRSLPEMVRYLRIRRM